MSSLAEPIDITFPLASLAVQGIISNPTNPSPLHCEYWDNSSGLWSSEGLELNVDGNDTVCSTTHLTRFRVERVKAFAEVVVADVVACADGAVLLDLVSNIQEADSGRMAAAVLVPVLLLSFLMVHTFMAAHCDELFQDPSDDNVAKVLYFWDIDPQEIEKAETLAERFHLISSCCQCRHKKDGKKKTALTSVLKRLRNNGIEAAEAHLEDVLVAIAGGDTDEDKIVHEQFGKDFLGMSNKDILGKSQSVAFKATLGWTQWSFREKVWHAWRKYNSLASTFSPSLQCSCKVKALLFWAAFLGSIFVQAMFYSVDDSGSKCEERRGTLSARIRLIIVISVVSACLSSLLTSCSIQPCGSMHCMRRVGLIARS